MEESIAKKGGGGQGEIKRIFIPRTF